MKRHIKVAVRPTKPGGEARRSLKQFAEDSISWSLVRFIDAPDEHTHETDVVIQYEGDSGWGRVNFGFVDSRRRLKEEEPPLGPRRPSTRKKAPLPHTRLLSVVFQSGRGHGLAECNEAVQRFLSEFRAYVRAKRLPVRVDATSGESGLEGVIPAARARRVFELFLSHHPRSGHPADEERLDFFICTAFRYRAEICPDEIAMYLREDLQWDEDESRHMATRIWTGLDLLRVNRGFRRLEWEYFAPRREG